jgi:hypothetical protein
MVHTTVPPRRAADGPRRVTVMTATGRAHLGRRRRALWRLDPGGRHPRNHPRHALEDAVRRLCAAGMLAPSTSWNIP